MRFTAKIVDNPSLSKPEGSIRLMCMSDSHGNHSNIPKEQIFPADIFIQAGDFTICGISEHVDSFRD